MAAMPTFGTPPRLHERKSTYRMKFCEVCNGAGFHLKDCPAEKTSALKRTSPAQVLMKVYNGQAPPSIAWDGYNDAQQGVCFW